MPELYDYFFNLQKGDTSTLRINYYLQRVVSNLLSSSSLLPPYWMSCDFTNRSYTPLGMQRVIISLTSRTNLRGSCDSLWVTSACGVTKLSRCARKIAIITSSSKTKSKLYRPIKEHKIKHWPDHLPFKKYYM